MRIEGGAGEPILLVTQVNAITAYIAKAEHVDAKPQPELKDEDDK
jgi:hypothetical protein